MWPSSREATVFMRHLVLVILCGWLSGMHTRCLSVDDCLVCIPDVCLSVDDCLLCLTDICLSVDECLVCLPDICLSVDDCLVYIPDSYLHRITTTTCRINTVVSPDWWWARSRPKHVETNKYTKNKYTGNKLCTKLALFTRLYRDTPSKNIKKSELSS